MSNKLRDFTDKVPPWAIVLVFILLVLWGLSKEADAAEITIGPTYLSASSSDGGLLLLSEDIGKYAFGIGVVSKQVCQCRNDTTEVPVNAFVQAWRKVGIYKGLSAGLGVSYWNQTTRVTGSHFNFALSLEYAVTDKLSLSLRHWSNAGSASPNLGQDAIMIGWKL